MFQFTGFASLAGYHTFNMVGCPIRIPADHIVCADPRSFSQLIASFIASESLGIPHTPLSSLSPDLLYYCPPPSAAASGGFLLVIYLYFTLLSCFFFSVRKDLNLLRTLSQYVNERSGRCHCPFDGLWPGQWQRCANVENIGVEPMTSCVQGRRSSQLS